MAKNQKKETVKQTQTQTQPPMSFNDYVTVLRNQIVLSYDGSKELALKNFDDITKRLVEQIQVNQALRAKPETPLVTPDKEPNTRK